jgi:4-diphosphocytidyl-2-C-methyl-D-erythritol kinase
MLTFPNAKINIGLYITRKREDGYHNLETVFYPVQVNDALEIIDRPDGTTADIHIKGMPVAGGNENNLVLKAYHMLRQDFPEKTGSLSIHLYKNIPMGAGMGGGSADGAFMLRMMNEHFNLGLGNLALEQYALHLGSDCPFFINNKPGFAAGRGELLEPVALDLSGYSIQIVCPEIHVGTAEAFSKVKPRTAPVNLKSIADIPIADWSSLISNDFETSIFGLQPQLAAIKSQLYEQGALYASMSGSGSSLYGIFKKGEKAIISSPIPFRNYLV